MDFTISVIVGIVSIIVFYGFGAVALATLLFLWVKPLGRLSATYIAALLMPGLAVFVVIVIAIYDPPPDMGAFAGEMIVVLAPGLLLGWPSAYLTRRALDKRIAIAGAMASDVFE